MQQPLTPYQSLYYAWLLTRRAAGDSVESLASTLVDSQVDLNPHQVEAALFACANPLSRGVILADEVGLGKTIEAGLVISQRWAERRRRILIIVPANLRKQWHQELQDKFNLQSVLLEAKSYNTLRKQDRRNPFQGATGPVICSYQFAKAKADNIKAVEWDLVVLDEAHRLRNVYKTSNVIAKTLKEALAHVHSKVLLTATPLQNSLLELYGLVSMIDDRVFGDIDSFRSQFTAQPREQAFAALRSRLATVCKRTLRRQVQQYVPYTARRAMVEEFTPSSEERELSNLVADYLRRPNLKALPEGQRQLISLVLWKLLASSTHAIAGALETMAKRLEGELEASPDVPDLAEVLDDDYESLDETADEWDGSAETTDASPAAQRGAVAQEIAELRHFKTLATNIRENAKGTALLTALDKAFAELERLGAAKKAIIFTESKRTQEYLLSLLEKTPYGEGIVLFNGTNSDARAQAVYADWIKRHQGTDKITGSRTADTRAALVEHFKERGTVMIATEAGAEGINLQFCSLVINFDLPWNPQRIEQRIGRCHRYGQKFDVVVVNFVDRSNEADARVYELLDQKFQLFEGVFGASDEVLGAIGSGVDFERRIADIYQNCRDPDAIKASFEQLQRDLSGEINEAMVKTRQILLENFDEEVQDKLRVRAADIWPSKTRVWAFGEETHKKNVEQGLVYWGKDGRATMPRIKKFLTETKPVVPRSIWSYDEAGHNQESKLEAEKIIPGNPFSTPKPEKLLKRVLEIATNPGDIVLDSFSGSGTTGAVAHKMGRQWIMIELEETCHSHIIPRLEKVIAGEDSGGITSLTDWRGGGGFRYFTLAPSLIVNDRWGNPVINPEYNATQLAEALAKLEGFTYAPSEVQWWRHGHSSERDFIYVTTQNLSADQLQALSDEVGSDQSLLVCCAAFHGVTAAKASERWPNLTLKKIPKMVLARCEWGHDDYSLNVANLPIAEKTEPAEEPGPATGAATRKTKKSAATNAGQGGLFGENEE